MSLMSNHLRLGEEIKKNGSACPVRAKKKLALRNGEQSIKTESTCSEVGRARDLFVGCSKEILSSSKIIRSRAVYSLMDCF